MKENAYLCTQILIFRRMKVKEIVCALERFAPLPLQDGWDNAGLQVGLTEAEVTGALLCLDVTEAVVDEAVTLGYNLIVSHHPLIFGGLKSITGRNYVERCVLKAIRHGITICSHHTNMDNATGGVNYKMAEKLGLKNLRFLAPKEESLLKLVTFVPMAQADGVRQALFDAGCGCIGGYDQCSYNLTGEGTFRAGEGCNPFCGNIGEMHREAEVRIETVLPAYLKGKAVRALLKAHPYEEPAYDLYPLKNTWMQAGSGLIGELPEEMEVNEFLQLVKRTFQAGCVKSNRFSGKTVRTIALCGGGGAFLLPKAIGQGADAFLTGEIKYHDYFGHEDDLLMVEIGHYESEQYTMEIFQKIIHEACPTLDVKLTSVDTNPIKYC